MHEREVTKLTNTTDTVLITGGATGIGLALAERFLAQGCQVIVVGRRAEKLAEAQDKHPRLITRVADVADEESRVELYHWVVENYPECNLLVNNAGIQKRINLTKISDRSWSELREEIAINLEGAIHLTLLFLPHLRSKERATIIQVTSGLSLIPAPFAPIYSATKAALRSFTLSLREQLADTQVRVVEILPPAVNTDLGGVGLHTFGEPLDAFADGVFADYLRGETEIGYGDAKQRLAMMPSEMHQRIAGMWRGFLQNNPDF